MLCKAQAPVNERRQQDGERPAAPAAAPAAASLVATRHDDAPLGHASPLAPDGWRVFIPHHLAGRAKEEKARRRKRRGWRREEGGGSRAP